MRALGCLFLALSLLIETTLAFTFSRYRISIPSICEQNDKSLHKCVFSSLETSRFEVNGVNGDPMRNKVSLVQKIDSIGKKLKPLALETKGRALSSDDADQKTKVFLNIKTCIFFFLFMVYRAYRGFFVIIPAVFRETNAKMKLAIESPFSEGSVKQSEEKCITTKRVNITVSVLSSLVVLSYVFSGAFKVFQKFIRTVMETSSLKGSFEAAADEIETNEDKLLKTTKSANPERK